MRFRAAAWTVAATMMLGAATAGSVAAGPIVDNAQRAESLLQDGDAGQAVDALQQAVAALWQESPLLVRKALLVESSSGLSIYQPRTDSTYAAGDKVQLYVEPWGFAYGSSGDLNTINLKLGLGIENQTGQVLAEQPDLFRVDTRTRDRYRGFSVALSFVMPELKPGAYVFAFTLDDQNSSKNARFRVPFSVAAAEAVEEPAAEAVEPQAATEAAPAADGESAAQ